MHRPGLAAHKFLAIAFLAALAALAAATAPSALASEITTATLLREMWDLDTLARMPDPPYRTVQFSSYDRRSVAPDAPDWYANADGFGGEPIPGFASVLRVPGDDGVGLYLVAEVEGPGAIVRGWSAGMGGTMRVFLDGANAPAFEGSGYDFLARRLETLLHASDIDLDCGDAFRQQDADYFPISFGRSLRITWEGKLGELHFYHLEVRLYPAGTPVRSFDASADVRGLYDEIRSTARRLTSPGDRELPPFDTTETTIEPNKTWTWEAGGDAGGVVRELRLRIAAREIERALRGTLLRIAFDGASEPQVEAPVGDFFGSGPGVNPFDSLPMAVLRDGTMICRFPMPFREKVTVTLANATPESVHVRFGAAVDAWTWDDRSLHFRARWRSDRDLDLSRGPFDLPFIHVRGRGRLVGTAVQVVNPSTIPTPGGNWWGEGDEKIFVDEEAFPTFFGTGSEDYFNYSWSRPDLFDHPYCGQPLDTGPGNLGYVSNHRWHILDSVPFERFLAFRMELSPHLAQPGLAYARTAYLYARPGAVDDHRRVQLAELVVSPLPPMEPEARGGASNATIHHLEDLLLPPLPNGDAGSVLVLERGIQPGASRGRLLTWNAIAGKRFKVTLAIAEAGTYALNLVAAHWPESGSLGLTLDGAPLVVDDLGGAGMGRKGEEVVVLRSEFPRRLLSTRLRAVELAAGDHDLEMRCLASGRFGFDYLWVQKRK